MVKQYFASPVSSAGVERVFSAAGKMHSDLKKSSKDDTLEASLFAICRIRTESEGGGGQGEQGSARLPAARPTCICILEAHTHTVTCSYVVVN